MELAVDDFDTGYSALSYLRELPVTLLKLDRSFVVDVATDPVARAVAASLIRLGAAYKLGVLAEGIETVRQAAVFRELGCRYAQGYHFGRPAAASPQTLSALRV